MTDRLSSKAQVAIEFGYPEHVVRHALLKHDFPSAGDLIDTLMCHEEALTQEADVKRQEKARALREETERLYRSSRCLVCVDKARVMLTLPCGHLSMCRRCEKRQRSCPVADCNMPIITAITTFPI